MDPPRRRGVRLLPSRTAPRSLPQLRRIPQDGGFRNWKKPYGLVRILLDWHPVVHLVDAQDLRLPTVAAKLVILAHDERLDRLGGTHLRAQATEAAPGEVEIEIVENLDLLAGLAVA